MLFSVAYLVVRRLLSCPIVLARSEVSNDAELLVLRHENAVLRRQISKARYQPGDRLWLAAPVERGVRGDPGDAVRVASAAGRTPLGLPQPAASRTAVHGDRDPQAGDPHGGGEPDLGHRRVQGELIKLGHRIAASTVWQILDDAGIDPAPINSAFPPRTHIPDKLG